MTAGDVYTVRGNLHGRKCAAFDDTDDYILADAHAAARVLANDTVGTYSAWVFCDNVTTGGTVLSAGDNDNANEYIKFWINGGALKIVLNHGGATQFNVIQTSGSIQNKTWTHVAVVQNGTRPILYVNGLAVAMTDNTATDLTFWYDELTQTDKFAIGVLESNNTHSSDFPGMISDVKYWNKALTAAEVAQDYNGDAFSDDATYLQLHLLKGDYGITDQGLGADNGTLTGHAYLCGLGNDWSRRVELNALVADTLQTVSDTAGNATTLILKAA